MAAYDARLWSSALPLAALALSCTGELGALPAAPMAAAVSERADGSDGAPLLPGAAPEGASGPTPLGRTGMHRLNNVEYENTVFDLLGLRPSMAKSFVAEEHAGFDNVAAALGMTPSQYESYFNAAEAIARELFADGAKRRALFPCTPSESDGGTCLGRVLSELGTRAFRRPLTVEEIAGLRATHARARALGESAEQALEHVLVAMLASPAFLYRQELAPQAPVSAVVPLDDYALAARLSYFVWSSMPDAELLRLAGEGSLRESATLRRQLERLLGDPRSSALVDNFAGQWLGLRELGQHKVLASKYPRFDDALRDAMIAEARAFFAEFLRTDRPLAEFLRAPLHFVDARLAAHYGAPTPSEPGFVRLTDDLDGRRGFLGLASFLTLSSFAHRTSPTLRAKWVLEELLCSPVPAPPPNVGELEDAAAANEAASIENVRARLALHRSAPTCAGCHAALDPIGLGLEGFDAIGRARISYENGDTIDTSGAFPSGKSFSGPVELAALLADDPRFLRCASEKLLTYALGRALDREQPLVDEAVAALDPQHGTLRDLIEHVVLSSAFRSFAPSGRE